MLNTESWRRGFAIPSYVELGDKWRTAAGLRSSRETKITFAGKWSGNLWKLGKTKSKTLLLKVE